MIADVVVGLQYGDEGKGKVTHQLARNNNYTHVVRYNGGCNAGHTIYHKGKKFVTHHVPCGVFLDIRSVIGPGCVINPTQLLSEINELEEAGIPARSLLRIASNAHIITDFHRAEDSKDTAIGTTRTGNGPAYRDKYARRGVRAMECPEVSEFIVDMYTELHENPEFDEVMVLCEGAQGFGLDIDWGDYPYVTSSHCTTSSAIANGIPHNTIRDVWGVAKVYETYVGSKSFEPDSNPVFEKIREAGSEYGSTTGRPRQIDWMTLEMLQRAIKVNGVTKVVFNKADILEDVGAWSVYDGLEEISFTSSDDMEHWLSEQLDDYCDLLVFSRDPERI